MVFLPTSFLRTVHHFLNTSMGKNDRQPYPTKIVEIDFYGYFSILNATNIFSHFVVNSVVYIAILLVTEIFFLKVFFDFQINLINIFGVISCALV
ncbi:hypothetical protein AFK68_20815 [Hydrocoleum sp. CS-953]|nr:hypothetical protein AFK68_20815 [Hydrocoleum sp. CS-953]